METMFDVALIPAAGRGFRLDRPGTPKPLVDVSGRPMIVRLIDQLRHAGVERVVVVLGYEGEKVEKTLRKYVDLGVSLTVVHNPDWEQGLARSVLSARKHIDAPFLLAMADHVFDDALVSTMAAVRLTEGQGAALVDTRLDEVFSVDTALKVTLEGDCVSKMGWDLPEVDGVDAGLFALSPAVFEDIDASLRQDTENHLCDGLSRLIERGEMGAVRAEGGRFDDVDTPAALVHAEMRLRRQRRIDRVSRPPAPPETPPRSRFDYAIDAPKHTEILVGRGFVRNPSSVPLIPDRSASSPIFVFTDETVEGFYGRRFAEALRAQGYHIHLIVLPDGEESKSLTNYAFLVERVLSKGVDEQSVFISLGGGVVCNVCGFVASTIYRGLDLVHMPTTLMSQCDAAISHKQGINGHQGKNLVGSYYSPRLVAVDVETLQTLDERLIPDGMSEIIKHAIGQDPAYVDLLMSYNGDMRDLDFLEEVITRNVALKCELVASDPKELREGMILQYGHTVGHAVEHLSGYSLYHGESVGVGMSAAARVARILGACDDSLVALHDTLSAKYKLPTRIPQSIRSEDILASLRYSKRFLTEGTRMALLSGVGELWQVDGDYAIPVSEAVLTEAVEQCKED